MESALRKEYSPVKIRNAARLPTERGQSRQVVTSDKFRTSIQQISDQQRKRDIIFNLQELLVKLTQQGQSQLDYAYVLQSFFEEIVFAETGMQSIKQGLRIFVDKMHAEPVITRLIQYVFKEMQKNLNFQQSGQTGFELMKVSSAMQEILTWYIERSSNLENLVDEEGFHSNYDRIFNLKVFHDQKRHHFLGLEVLAGLALYGRAGQNLWFKVFIKENGEYILPHVDWNSWIDDTEVFTSKPLDEDVAISGIVPISPQTQRLMIDRLSVFIPYAALDLSPGKHEVEVEICLFNEKGDKLLTASSEEVLSVSRSYRSHRPAVSEQALGIWSKDYITGDCINDLEVACIQQPSSSLLGDLIKINFDFEIYNRLNESLFIEVRFYNSGGALIKTTNEKDSDQFAAVRHEIYVDEIIFKRYGLELAVPRIQLNVEDEDHSISCEICMLSHENKVLCGVLQSFTLPEARKITVRSDPAPEAGPPVKKNLIQKFLSLTSAAK